VSDSSTPFPDETPDPSPSPRPLSEDVTHMPVGARIPEKIGRGVFCTAAIVLQTSDVFVVDFLSTMVPPQHVGARIVMTVPAFAQFLAAMGKNLTVYEEKYGKLGPRTPRPAAAPTSPSSPTAVTSSGGDQPPVPRKPGKPAYPTQTTNAGLPTKITDIYDQIKLADDLLGGAFANVVIIRHASEEFCLDFIANFYPRPAVTARVFLPAGRVPSMLEAMNGSLEKYRQKLRDDASRGDASQEGGSDER